MEIPPMLQLNKNESVDSILDNMNNSNEVSPRHLLFILKDIAYALDEIKSSVNELVFEMQKSPRTIITSKLDASVGNSQMVMQHQSNVMKRIDKLELILSGINRNMNTQAATRRVSFDDLAGNSEKNISEQTFHRSRSNSILKTSSDDGLETNAGVSVGPTSLVSDAN